MNVTCFLSIRKCCIGYMCVVLYSEWKLCNFMAIKSFHCHCHCHCHIIQAHHDGPSQFVDWQGQNLSGSLSAFARANRDGCVLYNDYLQMYFNQPDACQCFLFSAFTFVTGSTIPGPSMIMPEGFHFFWFCGQFMLMSFLCSFHGWSSKTFLAPIQPRFRPSCR